MYNDMSFEPLSTGQLIKSLVIAIAVAAVLLVVAVLPAEYGVDPLGAGRVMGLTQLAANDAVAEEVAPAATGAGEGSAPVIQHAEPFQSKSLTVTLEAFEGIEVKAQMAQGEQFAFNWATDGAPVYTDMHGEKLDAASDEFSTYWKEKQQQSGQGVFTAPFDGTHGWYWQNMTEEPIVINVEVSGFFRKVYIPGA